MGLQTNRNQAGQGIIVLGLILAVLFILVIGLFSFEINMVEVARSQLRSATEAASLAGAATLASQPDPSSVTAQQTAEDTALDTFERNTVAGRLLKGHTNPTKNKAAVPAAGETLVCFEFLDPSNNNAPVAQGDPNGKIMRITATLGLKPFFADYLGLPTVPLQCVALGGVPDMDLVLCFDISGSMDDQTPVAFVKRSWDSTNSKIQYTIAQGCPGSAQGAIYDIVKPKPTGTQVNAVYPQNLDQAGLFNCAALNFNPDLRGADPNGPPGDYPSGSVAGKNDASTFTDMVVLGTDDPAKPFVPFTTPDGYAFPTLGTLVEAARGNLEDATVFGPTRSMAATGVPATVKPRAGYQAAYFKQAMGHLHPISESKAAADLFFTIMNTNTCAHFSLVTFADKAGTSANDSYSTPNISSGLTTPSPPLPLPYPQGGTGQFPTPMVPLDATPGSTNFPIIDTQLLATYGGMLGGSPPPALVASTGTNMGQALHQAVQELTDPSKTRPGSKKAIVLFTDGQPTDNPLQYYYSPDGKTSARKAATDAHNAGIPIYTIGLVQNPAIKPGEDEILNDTNANVSTGGVAAIAGNDGKYYSVSNPKDLPVTFEKLARRLVQLVN